MANSLTVKVLEDGPRNAVVNLVGVVDSSDMTQAPAISLNQFLANGRDRLVGLRVIDVNYSVTPDLVVKLDWNANTPQPIGSYSGSNKILAGRYGGVAPDRTAGGYDGNINLTTKGFVAGKTYGFTLRVEMVKIFA